MTGKPKNCLNATPVLFTTDFMKNIKVFVRADKTATIICPSCNTAKHTSVAPYLHKKHLLKIRCKCNARFSIQLDFRHHYRKQTSLPGTYRVIDPPGGGGGVIHIRNISQGGIGFSVSGLHRMEKEQALQLEFHLNDKNQTKLIKQARICIVENNYIGCEFIDPDLLEKALGFYLRP